MTTALIFACYEKACAPPPVGVGGSKGGNGKSTGWAKAPWGGQWDKGQYVITKAHGMGLGGSYSVFHVGTEKNDEYRSTTRGKPAKKLGSPANLEQAKQLADAHAAERRGKFPEIGAEGIRGDSKPVSSAEFQRLANIGQDKLDGFAARATPITGLDDNWDSVKASSYEEATKSWGGATIDAHTGQALPQGANKWALTVKDKGFETVSVPEGASKAEFDAAMDQAKRKFRSILEREDHHLGVFHDDDLGRIDIDPVLVVSRLEDVHTIGAATRAIGGAYNFADGNGYWPPHVREGE